MCHHGDRRTCTAGWLVGWFVGPIEILFLLEIRIFAERSCRDPTKRQIADSKTTESRHADVDVVRHDGQHDDETEENLDGMQEGLKEVPSEFSDATVYVTKEEKQINDKYHEGSLAVD